jgi:DNA-binding IclR family transcriptional regulator
METPSKRNSRQESIPDRRTGKTRRTDGAGKRPVPRAPARALLVVELLADVRSPMSLSALSTRLALPKTSLMHMLRALEAASYVQRTHAGYQLGPASHRMAMKIGVTSSFDEAARPVLQAMLEATGETVLLGAFSEARTTAVYTTRYPSPQAVRFAPEVGEHRPLYATGVGKVLLAYAPSDFLDNYLERTRLESFTAKTVTSRKALREQLQRIRESGMAASIDEMAAGGSALAAPVFDREGGVSTALVVAVPTFRMAAHRKRMQEALLDGARKLSELKGMRTG